MATDRSNYNVLIASYLEPEHVERIRSVDGRLKVMYDPGLLRPPRYAADHKGRDVSRSPEQETRWLHLLGEADILFDFDQTHREDLPDTAHEQLVTAFCEVLETVVKNPHGTLEEMTTKN